MIKKSCFTCHHLVRTPKFTRCVLNIDEGRDVKWEKMLEVTARRRVCDKWKKHYRFDLK